jgi:Flp pilus assembly protein TadG
MDWLSRMRARRALDRSESGAAAVELALVTPLFLMLVFGIIAFGTIYTQKLSLGNSARQAARIGVVSGQTCDQIKTHARDAARGTLNMDTSAVTVAVKRGATEATATDPCSTSAVKPCEGSASNDQIFVTATYESSLIIPLAVVDNAVTVAGKGVFRCEFS